MLVRLQSLLRICTRLAALALTAALFIALIAQFVRDRSPFWSTLYHLPPLPLAIAAGVLDLLLRGHALRRQPRFALVTLSAIAAATHFVLLTGHRAPATPPANAPTLHVLQWNVQWGGGRARTADTWHSIVADALARQPDVVILSEAPDPNLFQPFERAAGPGWHAVHHENAPHATYWYRLTIAARFPVRDRTAHPVRNGAALSARVDTPAGPLRVLAVDGVSDRTVPRQPLLGDVTALCRAASAAGDPFHVVAGDFNTTARSIAFDDLRAADYALAGETRFTYRATFPAKFPLYDIDHVWLSPNADALRCTFFQNALTDHRGQICELLPSRK